MVIGRIWFFADRQTEDCISSLVVSWNLLSVLPICASLQSSSQRGSLLHQSQQGKEFASKMAVRSSVVHSWTYYLTILATFYWLEASHRSSPHSRQVDIQEYEHQELGFIENHLPHLSNSNPLIWMIYLLLTEGWKRERGEERPCRQKKEGHEIWFHDSWSMIAAFPLNPHICRNEGYSLRAILFLANLTLGLPCNLFPTLLLINCFILPFTMRKFSPISETYQFLGKSLLIHSSRCWFHW